MFSYLPLLLVAVPILELMFIIRVGAQIGPINTVALLIVVGIAGGYLARIQGFQALKNIQKNLEQGILPNEDMLDGFLILCGGILLVIPGFFTDIIGIIFLVPTTRAIIKIFFRKKMQQMAQRGEVITFGSRSKQKKRGYENYEDADFS